MDFIHEIVKRSSHTFKIDMRQSIISESQGLVCSINRDRSLREKQSFYHIHAIQLYIFDFSVYNLSFQRLKLLVAYDASRYNHHFEEE